MKIKRDMKNTRLVYIMGLVVVILMIPFITMQFTNEVDWSLFDFAVMGILLAGTGLLIELVLRNVRQLKYRLILCGIIVAILFLVWVELAVGIFGTPLAGS
ncbi:hypothetical protein OO013_05525 [Mangrovivirga sp. M17]|uniref:Uncharacterized protein n=1 Tax=Mangrovivirga halotolerans TaxID=2993936 RepID=A0ABT3RNF9_9BACT|nr:hypothetical protein [Mangrovivirga halotolerans]MCX2743314.1 hypothetical protein [Mangrovivirga halotolerans]